MYRNARRWASRSLLLDSWAPRWLGVGGKAKHGKNAERPEDSAQLATSVQTTGETTGSTLVGNPDDSSALGGHDKESRVDAIGEADLQSDLDPVSPSLAEAFAAARETGVRSGGLAASVLSAHGPVFAAFGQNANGYRSYAGIGTMGEDPLAPYLPQSPGPAVSGQGSAAVAGGRSHSGKVVILESSPSAAAVAAHHGGSNSLAFGMPFGVCGCGYFTSPTRILDWAHGGALLQQDGQLPGTRLTEGPDYVATIKRAIGASVSDPLLDRNLSPLSNWRATVTSTNLSNFNGSLPGGGEMGTLTGTKGRGVLSGSVTTPPITQRSLATQSLAAQSLGHCDTGARATARQSNTRLVVIPRSRSRRRALKPLGYAPWSSAEPIRIPRRW